MPGFFEPSNLLQNHQIQTTKNTNMEKTHCFAPPNSEQNHQIQNKTTKFRTKPPNSSLTRTSIPRRKDFISNPRLGSIEPRTLGFDEPAPGFLEPRRAGLEGTQDAWVPSNPGVLGSTTHAWVPRTQTCWARRNPGRLGSMEPRRGLEMKFFLRGIDVRVRDEFGGFVLNLVVQSNVFFPY
ncbi:hypothetical protein SLEP1_g14012 [Rubroshorea leprosula]|uniref:Uncharacterized protein n=1 Tax=Rubroshorea leprosula TaxID=152421 RepID=A0AAV5IHN0_9ROSI|nr:hypothetical protein SLEP1_g14012 [Rubroshorea leprosula]